jgi:hypothetical protein
MKKIIYVLILASLMPNLSCQKEPILLPTEVELGTTKVYINGEEVDYKSKIWIDSFYNYLSIGFIQDLFPELIISSCGFTWMEVREGTFDLHEEGELFIGAKTAFTQIISEDYSGYEYELINKDEGFLRIDRLDLTKNEISGSFLAEYRRTKRNGYWNTGLPRIILIQGVFNEPF